jgi:hypothetical protein
MRALQAFLERRPNQPRGEKLLTERVVPLEQIAVMRGERCGRRAVDLAEDVFRLLDLLAQPHLTIFHARRPFEIVDVVHLLQRHRDAFEAVGDLAGNRLQVDAADLLKVGELRDLEAVEHHLPADAPRAQRGRFPIVLFEADVVLAGIDATRFQRLEIQVLDLVRRRLEDHLKLMVLE